MNHDSLHANYGADHGTIGSYITGFFACVALTLIPFYMAREHIVSGYDGILIITLFAIMQLLVQVYYFLHLSMKSRIRWNLLAFVFTGLFVLFIVAGSLWIMTNLTHSMSSSELQQYMHTQN